MWVKICANTNLEDARLAAELGADAVGFVFAPSKRQVTAAQVAEIVRHLDRAVETIGVFYADNADEIYAVATEAGLSGIQLHGDLSEGLAGELHARFQGDRTIIQTVHWRVPGATEGPDATDAAAAGLGAQLAAIASWGTVNRVLIDSKVGSERGGTGVAFDWVQAERITGSADPRLRVVVAGGLNPGNVAEAIRTLGPWGVDVASGVESVPGRKDASRLASFLKNARAAAG
jgi:phosphoribosylanthranilate isomerase